MRIRQTVFGGIAPKQTDANLSGEFARVAENVNLERGSIQPWHEPKKISDNTGAALFIDDCCVLTGPCAARFAVTGLDCERIIAATGIVDYPAFTDDCGEYWQPLGFPCGMDAPRVTAPDADEQFSMELRSYYYTAINHRGWESQPSAPSVTLRTNVGKPVTVGGFDVPDNAVALRIYRAQSPLDFGEPQKEERDDEDPAYLFVGEIDASQPTFTDDVTVAGHACDTEDFDSPPDDLRELCSWREGRLAGLIDDQFIMSERSRPHAWPEKFTVSFYDRPLALRCIERKAYVLTDGRPAVLALKGDCGDEHPIDVYEIPQPLPIVSRRSAAIHLGGVVYASRHGLVMVQDTQAAIITAEYYTAAQWAQLLPHTMHGAVCDGYYYGATDNAMIRFRLPDNIFAPADKHALTTLTLRPQALHCGENGRLYLALHDGTYQWNAGHAPMLARWRGAVHTMPGRVRMSAYRLRTKGNVQVRHYADGALVQDVPDVGNHAERLPVGYAGEDWQVEVLTRHEVSSYTLAPSIRELSHD